MNGATLVRIGAIALLVAQAALLWAALAGDDRGGSLPVMPVVPAAAPADALTIESAISLTDPVARAWRDAAVLISASMEVVWPSDDVTVPSEIAEGGAMTLVYAGGGAQLALILDRGSGVIFHAEEGEWSDELLRPLPVSAVARSSALAVLAAEVSYGTSYRAACPQYRYVTRVYLTTDGTSGNPRWLVSYVDDRHRDRPDIQIEVDAVTGETVGGEAAAIACADE